MQQPGKLVPALRGGAVMALISSIPGVNLINCACCGGLIGVYLFGPARVAPPDRPGEEPKE